MIAETCTTAVRGIAFGIAQAANALTDTPGGKAWCRGKAAVRTLRFGLPTKTIHYLGGNGLRVGGGS
ncbi:hypothetical protein [Nocardia brasiliensis]|uniref:hypothetical protein n=1 Tax=Nocardia brasiliensis TaxID=37326 RepID=UPI0018952959|nr:hypothetical protein [Nocardia brasiliensis]MBF6543186.1 hypothetical protein [Nocardia brasiliensis]